MAAIPAPPAPHHGDSLDAAPAAAPGDATASVASAAGAPPNPNILPSPLANIFADNAPTPRVIVPIAIAVA